MCHMSHVGAVQRQSPGSKPTDALTFAPTPSYAVTSAIATLSACLHVGAQTHVSKPPGLSRCALPCCVVLCRAASCHAQADGGEMAAAVCAASAALADAGIELSDILPACSVVSLVCDQQITI